MSEAIFFESLLDIPGLKIDSVSYEGRKIILSCHMEGVVSSADLLLIQLSQLGAGDKGDLRILDGTGRILAHQSLSANTEGEASWKWDTQHLPSGLYYVLFQSDQGTVTQTFRLD